MQTLPRIMNVAVRCDQHSMRLGHLALSQTVSSRSSSISRAVKWLPLPSGTFFLSHRGSRSGQAWRGSGYGRAEAHDVQAERFFGQIEPVNPIPRRLARGLRWCII